MEKVDGGGNASAGVAGRQRVLVVQQAESGESKVRGIRLHGGDRIHLETFDIVEALPPILDETDTVLPATIDADLVLDFLKHPDLSHDLALRCAKGGVPMIASGRKLRVAGVLSPPT